jgi:tripartite-type tricarboxylate transporter receptor subunit TctC
MARVEGNAREPGRTCRLGIAALAAVAALAASAPSRAADYPSKPLILYIGSAPGGSTDVLGRVLAKSLQDALGQPVVVQNRTGAGGAVMATQLMQSAPDGYSLGMAISQAYSGNPVLTPTAIPYRVGDFTHLASISKGQCALVTSAAKPYRTFEDVMAAARRGERPIFAAQSPLSRIVIEYIAKVAGVRFRVITVQGGGEMMQTILGGHADFGFSGGPHVDHVAAGQMRVLASAEDGRLTTSPEVPTLKELGYDITSCSMFVVSAPPRLPEDVKRPLAAALEHAITSADMTALIERLRYPEYYFGPDDVTRLLEAETATFTRAVEHLRQ